MRRSPVIATFVAAALLALVATAESFNRTTTAAELDDPTIVAIFDAANTADIETGKLAAERGGSAEVREFGAMLARDHQQVRQLGRDLAAKLRVTPTPPKDDASARAHANAIASLRATSGADFDRAFLQHEAAFHKAVIDAVQGTLLPAIRNEELRALVVKVAPAFQAHMLAAQNLEKKLAAGATR
jgi:putative membrane protein